MFAVVLLVTGLAHATELTWDPAAVYAGAPYLRQMPSGTTVLSIQSTEGGRSQPQMVVYLGDRNAKHFTAPSIPIKLGTDTRGMWNALFVKSSNSVTAISSTTIQGVRGLWAIDGVMRNESGD